MAARQGSATAWVRKGKILITADSNVLGGWYDEHGDRRGAVATDFETFSSLVAESETDAELGANLRNALSASQINRPEGWADARGRNWSLLLASEFGLKSASSVYQGMRMISATWARSEISLLPSRRRYGGGFDFFGNDDADHPPIVIPFDATNADIGAALRRCLANCR